MTPTDDRRYSPRELAAMFPGTTVEQLRIWEAAGKVAPAVRTLGGHRRYTEQHVAEIAKIMGPPRRP
jgi:DNA-binding transcriptional MerR regulator